MAFISKEYLQALKEAKLTTKEDVRKISELTKQARLRNGKGYCNAQIRNVLYHAFSTTDEVVAIIIKYYQDKKKMVDNQKAFANQLQNENRAAV